MPDFKFKMVDDEALPAPHEWALIDDNGTVYAAVKCSALGPRVIAEVLSAYRSWRASPEVTLPTQRGASLRPRV